MNRKALLLGWLVTVVGCAVALSACGGGSRQRTATHTGAPVITTIPETTAVPATTVGPATTAPPATGPVSTGPAAPPATTVPITSTTVFVPLQTATSGEFFSPSKNINCEIDYAKTGLKDSVYCQVDSSLESVTMSTNGSYTVCRGQTCMANPGLDTPTLAYGQTTGAGPFRCTSTVNGMICTASGRGFEISRSGVAAVS